MKQTLDKSDSPVVCIPGLGSRVCREQEAAIGLVLGGDIFGLSLP